jgi:hypothetical protein
VSRLSFIDKISKEASMSLPHQRITLSKDIVAIGIEAVEGGTPQLAALTHLPTGTEATIVGEGFNSRTVKVCCNDCSYFVFLRDIEEPDSSYYLP